jgi:hypothetical protein
MKHEKVPMPSLAYHQQMAETASLVSVFCVAFTHI